MKKLTMIIIAVSLIFIYGCCGCGNYKYTVSDAAGHIFKTNQITAQNGCIKFLDESENKNPITLCGSYAVQENKGYKPEKK